MPNNPNVGPITALVTAFLSALMAFATAFNIFHFDQAQQTSVLTLAIASVAGGLYLFSILHVSASNNKVSALAVTGTSPITPAPVAPAPPVPPVAA